MSLEDLYNWQEKIRTVFPRLGAWQGLALAIYSLGMVLARHSAASRAAEKLGLVGKPASVQRR